MADKPFVMFIDSGFKYEIENLYKRKCELISRNFQGTVITYGDHGNYQFDNINVKVFRLILPPKRLLRYFLAICKAIMISRNILYCVYFALKRRLLRKPLDLIVTYDPLTTGLTGVLVSKIARVPLIVEVNGDYTAWSNYSQINNKRRREFKRNIAIKKQQFVFKRASGIKTLYKEQLDLFQDIVKDKVVRVFPNYLNVKDFKFISERKNISIVGFPFVVKGIDLAIEGFKRIADKFPDWTLEILGFYPYWEAKKIDRLIEHTPQIKRLPPIDRTEMPDYIGKTGIVLCASRTEGFPRVIKEAMQASKPCVASDVGGLKVAFENETNGLIFESENTEQLASKLKELMSSSERRKELGDKAHIFSRKEYSDDAFANYVNEFYQTVIGKTND